MEILLKYFTAFTPHQLQQFDALAALYTEWNQKINVISRKDIDSLYEKHILHCLSLAAVFDFKPGMRVVDIGCGGGFPTIPLAILYPEVSFHAVDSINKKLVVVNAVADGVGLTNVTTQHTRAEQITDRKFEVAISRAVAPLADLARWSKPLLRKAHEVVNQYTTNEKALIPAGLICLKGGDLAQEIHDSGKRPRIWEIGNLYSEPFFAEKYILQALP
ncbi:MAG: 16S rRNA (guanine(527)-N(7))-methyltransferase RsmG [Bacteroidetes bacterium]|nr:MAG: 16S rRNA (guanine(527)-N(7))-methyltransferase RsmG [Bacteroidota bacterium]